MEVKSGNAMARLLLVNGPNLNLLGSREPSLYGQATLAEIEQRLVTAATGAGHVLDTFQSNAEHELIERVQQAGRADVAYIIINPAALTHTSVALRDALLATTIPFVEVHLSNVAAREPFRRHSYFSDIASGTIAGLGALGYDLALQAVLTRLATTRTN